MTYDVVNTNDTKQLALHYEQKIIYAENEYVKKCNKFPDYCIVSSDIADILKNAIHLCCSSNGISLDMISGMQIIIINGLTKFIMVGCDELKWENILR